MFGPVETKLDELTTRRFINFLCGSGKSTQMIWTINKILENGETCLVITPETYFIKFYFPNNEIPQGVKVIHIDKVLKYLKKYSLDSLQDPNWKQLKDIEMFKADRIVVDPECYIKMLQQYVEKFNTIDKCLEKIKKLY